MNKRGRPRFEATDEQRKNVEIMVGLGIRQEDICLVIRDRNDKPISKPTLLQHFRKEIDTGATKLNSMVGNFMVETILGREPPQGSGAKPITDERVRGSLMELFAAARLGWRKTDRIEQANAEGRPFIFQVSKTDSKL